MATAWTILLQSQTNEVNHLFYSRRGVKASESFDVPVDWALSVADLLQKVEAALDQIPWGRFPTATSAGEEDSTGQWHVQIGEGTGEASESLVLRCHSSSSKIHIASSLGMSRQSNAFCVRIQRQWRHILDVVSDPEKTDSLLVDLKVVSTQDLQQLWSWNARVPEGVSDDCIHHIFMRRARRHPEALAVCAHDGDWTYLELDELSTRLALALIHRNLQTRQIVVIYIEKSKWVPVAQLAVMKAGCASVVLDASLPLERQRVISALVNSRFVLTSRASSTSAAQLGELVSLTIDTETSKTWPAVRSGLLPAVSPEQACYIVFTSGSTGTPKGVTITHQNYASAIATQSSHLGFEEFDRVFDFTSYAFDVSDDAAELNA